MNAEPVVIGRRFWWRWLYFTLAGFVLGFIVGFVLGNLVLGNVSIGIGVGAGVGLFQWLLLKRFIPSSARWILASTISLFVSLGLYAIVWLIWKVDFDMGWPMGGLGWAAAFLVGGGLMGWLQLPVLRRSLPRPEPWVIVSALGWCVCVFPMAVTPNFFLSLVLGGVVLGATTGGGLVLLLRKTPVGELASG